MPVSIPTYPINVPNLLCLIVPEFSGVLDYFRIINQPSLDVRKKQPCLENYPLASVDMQHFCSNLIKSTEL